jgi:hypothetical protein
MTSFCFLGAEDRLRGIVPSSAGIGDSTFSFESVTFDFFRTITFFFGDPSLSLSLGRLLRADFDCFFGVSSLVVLVSGVGSMGDVGVGAMSEG